MYACVRDTLPWVLASERCGEEKRKTINGEDVLWAMQVLGFDNYCETLKSYLFKYREGTKTDRYNEVFFKDPALAQQFSQPYDAQPNAGSSSSNSKRDPAYFS